MEWGNNLQVFLFLSDIPHIDKALLYDNIYEELVFDTNKAKNNGLTIADDSEFYWSLPFNFKGNMVRVKQTFSKFLGNDVII